MNKRIIAMILGIVLISTSCSKRVNSEMKNINSENKNINTEVTTENDNNKNNSEKDNNKELLSQKEEQINPNYVYPIDIKFTDNELLDFVVDNNWGYGSAEQIIGARNSYFNRYDVYFDKGIAVSHSESEDEKGRTCITGRIFNIVFNHKYNDEIINGITIETPMSQVKEILGEPHFINVKYNIAGYKGNDFYVFFVGEGKDREISIYRRDPLKNKDIINNILSKYNNPDSYSELVYKVVGEIQHEIPESHYNYYFGYKYSDRRGRVGIGFLSQGIKVFYNHYSDKRDTEPFIFLGSNYEGYISSNMLFEDKNDSLGKKELVKLELDKDYIFEEEIKRLEYEEELKDAFKSEKAAISPDGTMMVMRNRDDSIAPSLSGGYLIYLNKDKPNVEFKAVFFNPSRFTWLSNRYIAYDVFKNGIHVYDVDKDESIRINYAHMAYINNIKEGIITYDYLKDNKDVQGTMTYSFDSEGNLLIDGNRVGK